MIRFSNSRDAECDCVIDACELVQATLAERSLDYLLP